MKKILFYDSYAKDGFIGGSNMGLLMLLKHKTNKDLQYIFLVNKINKGYYENKVKYLGVEDLKVNFPRQLFEYNKKYEKGLIKQLLLFILVILPFNIKLAYLLRKNSISKVVCNESRAALTVGTAAKLAGIPLITFLRGDYLLNSLMIKICMKISNSVICISSGLYDLMKHKYKNKLCIINDGIEFMDITNNRNLSTINIINVANIVPIKGQIILAKAIKEVLKSYKNIKCYMVGEFVDKKYYQILIDYIENNGLSQYIKFVGFISNVHEYLDIGDIYVQPSLSEGLGISILEAYLHELPAVVSSLPGIKSVVKDNYNGLLFEKENYMELKEKLVKLIGDPELRKHMGRNGKNIVKTEYNIVVTSEIFQKYISK